MPDVYSIPGSGGTLTPLATPVDSDVGLIAEDRVIFGRRVGDTGTDLFSVPADGSRLAVPPADFRARHTHIPGRDRLLMCKDLRVASGGVLGKVR